MENLAKDKRFPYPNLAIDQELNRLIKDPQDSTP